MPAPAPAPAPVDAVAPAAPGQGQPEDAQLERLGGLLESLQQQLDLSARALYAAAFSHLYSPAMRSAELTALGELVAAGQLGTAASIVRVAVARHMGGA